MLFGKKLYNYIIYFLIFIVFFIIIFYSLVYLLALLPPKLAAYVLLVPLVWSICKIVNFFTYKVYRRIYEKIENLLG